MEANQEKCVSCEGSGRVQATPESPIEICGYCKGLGYLEIKKLPEHLNSGDDPMATMDLDVMRAEVADFDADKLSPFAQNMLATMTDEREALFFLLMLKAQLAAVVTADHYKKVAAALRLPLIALMNDVISENLKDKIKPVHIDMADMAILATPELAEVGVEAGFLTPKKKVEEEKPKEETAKDEAPETT